MNISEKDVDTLNNMSKRGGGFVKALFDAFRRADPFNFNKLKNAFPEYWKEYEKM